MASQSQRRSISTRRRFVRLRCEQFENRITPSLFNVHSPLPGNGQLNNNGCVAVAEISRLRVQKTPAATTIQCKVAQNG